VMQVANSLLLRMFGFNSNAETIPAAIVEEWEKVK